MKQNASVLYMNFSPYDNAGKILDYLISNYKTVAHFSYDHLRLKNGRNTNILTVYKNGKKISSMKLITTRAPRSLLFLSLPIVAASMIIQTIIYTYKLRKTCKKFDILLTVNAFPVCIGMILKKLSLVDKITYWVWDYYPPGSPSFRMRIIRHAYWFFDKYATYFADTLVFPNKRLELLRKKNRLLDQSVRSTIVPIGTTVNYRLKPRTIRKTIILGHLGMLKWEQGLDFIFDNLEVLINRYPSIKLEIIGSGPEEDRFRTLAQKYNSSVVFHGFVESDNKVNTIIRRWTIAIATYVPDKSNPSYWTDPSKIKRYLSQGVPTITTHVPDLSRDIHLKKSGVVIKYGNQKALLTAIDTIMRSRIEYSRNALEMAQAYDYKILYRKILPINPR